MARRSKRPGEKQGEPPESARNAGPKRALEMLRDSEGAVILGWVGEGVFYSRIVGTLSVDTGEMLAARLRKAVAEVQSFRYFSDLSELQTYDLLARSAVTRVLLANRRRFADIVVLTWSEGVNAAERAFVAAIGDPISLLSDRIEFENRLLRAAPFAKQTLDPSTWTVTVASRT
jgi:hypothetical protein